MALAGGPDRAPLEIRGLLVDYGTRRAVDGLTLSVRPGEIYGLLGSNGAGKTSTIKSVVGLLPKAIGEIRIFGIDPRVEPVEAKSRIGYVAESPLLYDALTPREFLEFVANVRRLDPRAASERARAFAEALQIGPEVDRPLGTLSQGTRQKVLLIAALLHSPGLLVLDEPLSHLDPRSVRIIRELLERYASEGGRGVLLSTHTMEVAERMCTRVGILDGGHLRGEGTLAELRQSIDRGNATLEEIFLTLTREDEAVRHAIAALGESR